MTSIDSRSWRTLAAILIASGMAVAGDQRPLVVNVIDGEGGFNDIRRGQVRTPVVEVHDDDGRPVVDAKVVFQLPDFGASATFPDGGKTLIATTDARGRASAAGLRPNKTEGPFTIVVVASKDGRSGRAEVRQSNTLAGGDPTLRPNNHTTLKILIAIAGAAGGVAVAAARGGKSSTVAAVAPTTLSVGAVTIGGPR